MNIRPHDEVLTADGVRLGLARRLFHRDPAETDPELLLFGSYLEVENLDYGDDYYIPTEAITGHNADGHLVLRVTMKQVMARTWTRLPDFVARGRAKIEKLAV